MVTEAVRQRTGLPLLVKLSPQFWNVEEAARAAEAGGADAVSLSGRFTGMRIDPNTMRTALAAGAGGVSGPAIRPLAVWQTYRVSGCVAIPIVAGGGIATCDDALEFILAGAAAVQVGIMTFVEPRTMLTIIDALPIAVAGRGFASIAELAGRAHSQETEQP
jgi:dihydroorotate dehydrogenase (NAD+) catalytic subunit